MSAAIVGIEKWKEENWTILADGTIVRHVPQVVVSDEKSAGKRLRACLSSSSCESG